MHLWVALLGYASGLNLAAGLRPVMAMYFRIDVLDLTESTLRQLVFDETPDRVTSGQADFLVPDLVADFRYRMTIFAVDRRSLATSRPVILDVQIKEAKGRSKWTIL